MELLRTVRSAPLFDMPFQIKPLRVIKQVVCMFMSTNGPKFQHAQPVTGISLSTKTNEEIVFLCLDRLLLLFFGGAASEEKPSPKPSPSAIPPGSSPKASSHTTQIYSDPDTNAPNPEARLYCVDSQRGRGNRKENNQGQK